jgi:DNA polymerase-3 subunit epsilon
MGFAVFDVETTGLFPNGHDRVAEIGIVLLDDELQIEATHTWLVNPERDLGPVHVHGLKASWMHAAPKFGEISGSIASLLTNRIVVGHNVSFDKRFLFSEFSRLGQELEESESSWFCTKAGAQWIWPGLPGYSLEKLCSKFGIENPNAHSALDDALATAKLLQEMSKQKSGIAGLLLASVQGFQEWQTHLPNELHPDVPRPEFGVKASKNLVQRIVADLPDFGYSSLEGDYLEHLSRTLEDGLLTQVEVDQLITLATEIGLGVEEVGLLHIRFFDQIAEKVWDDGVMTKAEKDQLVFVGEALGISSISVERSLLPRDKSEVRALFVEGSQVCLTGTMRPDKAATKALLEANGVLVSDGVSKRTNAVVAADPDSLSGKASKARSYGIPVYSAEYVWSVYSAD